MVKKTAALVSSVAVVLLCVSCTPSSGTAKTGSAGSSARIVRSIEKDARQLLDEGDDFEEILDDLAVDFPEEGGDLLLDVLVAMF